MHPYQQKILEAGSESNRRRRLGKPIAILQIEDLAQNHPNNHSAGTEYRNGTLYRYSIHPERFGDLDHRVVEAEDTVCVQIRGDGKVKRVARPQL